MAEKLCLRTYGEIVRPYMKKKSIFKPNVGRTYVKNAPINGSGKHAFYSMLLDSLISGITDEDTDIPDLNNSLTTRLRKGEIDIPSKFVEIAQGSTIIESVEQYFCEYLIPNLPQESLVTVNDAILSLIDNDVTIGKTKQKLLKDSFDSSAPARFHAEVFIYAVQRNQNQVTLDEMKLENETVSSDNNFLLGVIDNQKTEIINNESIFINFNKTTLYFSNYFRHTERLFYPENTVDEYLNKLVYNIAIIIKGRQGAGKTTLALKLAELLQIKSSFYKIMYTNIVADWYHVLAQIQHLRTLFSDCKFIWIIDDIHKSSGFEQEIVNWPFSGNDKYIFITRDIDKTKGNPYKAENSRWDDECVIKLDINNITFAKYLYADPCYRSLAYRDVEKIFSMCGGDLTLLENYKELYGESISELSVDEQDMLRDVFSFYFPNSRYTIQIDEFMDALKMLVMGMLDFPISPSLQNRTCNTILSQFCYSNIKGELEFEHASIAELLFSCITNYLQLDFILIYEKLVREISHDLVSPNLRRDAITFRVNVFLQSMLSYKFALPINKNKKASLNRDAGSEEATFILKNHTEFISASTWKLLLNDKRYRYQNIDFFKESIRSDNFVKAILNSRDFNFRFIYKVLPESEINVINESIIQNIRSMASQMDNSSVFILLLRSLKDDIAITFLEMLDQETIIKAIFNNDDGFFGFSCGLKYFHFSVIEKLEERIGVDNLEKIILSSSMSAILQFIRFFTINRQHLFNIVSDHREKILKNQMENSYSVRRICQIQSIIKKLDANLLVSIENTFGQDFYLDLLEGMGNIQDLYDLLASCTSVLRVKILDFLERSNKTSALIDKVTSSTLSIGTLNLSLKSLKMASSDDFERLDYILGVEIFINLIAYRGSVMDLLRIISRTTSSTAEKILNAFLEDYDMFLMVVNRTIEKRISIGTLGLVLHDFENSMLIKIEKLFTAKTYMELCRSNGNLAILIGIMQHSSMEMQIALATFLERNSKLKVELLNNTIEDEKKIGTFALCLKSLKDENEESLILFENAMGANDYLKLISERGNIAILARFLQYMSDNMRKNFLNSLDNNPMTFDRIFENTFADEVSVGTFHFSLREMGKQDYKLLCDFESILGVKRYLKIICDLGNLIVLFQILQYSTPEFMEKIIREFEKDNDFCRRLLERTIKKRPSIRVLSLLFNQINKKNPNLMDQVDRIIGADEWINLFCEMGDIMTLFGCLAEMSNNMKGSILRQLIEQNEYFNTIISNTVEGKISLGTLPLHIKSINNRSEPDIIIMLERLFTPTIFLLLMKQQGRLLTFIQALGEFSEDYLNTMQQEEIFSAVDRIFERSLSEKDILFNAHYGIRGWRSKNIKLLNSVETYLGKDRYKQLLARGSSLFNALSIAAHSTLGKEICDDIIIDKEYFKVLLQNNRDTDELSNGFETEIYSAVMKRNTSFEKIINELISDEQWIEYFSNNCNLYAFLCNLRWLQGIKIKHITETIISDESLINFFLKKWHREITDEFLNSRFVKEALDVIRIYSPVFVDMVEDIAMNT